MLSFYIACHNRRDEFNHEKIRKLFTPRSDFNYSSRNASSPGKAHRTAGKS